MNLEEAFTQEQLEEIKNFLDKENTCIVPLSTKESIKRFGNKANGIKNPPIQKEIINDYKLEDIILSDTNYEEGIYYLFCINTREHPIFKHRPLNKLHIFFAYFINNTWKSCKVEHGLFKEPTAFTDNEPDMDIIAAIKYKPNIKLRNQNARHEGNY